MGKERLLERVFNDREVLMVGKNEDEGGKGCKEDGEEDRVSTCIW